MCNNCPGDGTDAGECPPGAVCPNKAASLADGKAAFTVFDVSALRMQITHIASDGEVLFKAPPVVPRSDAQKPGLWGKVKGQQ